MRSARERVKLTQVEVSARLNVSLSLCGQWERGDREPSLEKFRQVVELYGVSADYLLGLDDNPRVADDAEDKASLLPSSRDAVLDARSSGLGLRDLADDGELVEALRIEPAEWAALASLEIPGGLTKRGYVSLLMLLRECRFDDRPDRPRPRGRPVGTSRAEHERVDAGATDSAAQAPGPTSPGPAP
jgi:transcriptional regulator with XRE-family HTH domain